MPTAVPAPLPLTFSLSRNTTINAGTNLSLSCLITPNTTGVDTPFTVESNITGLGTLDSERVTVSELLSLGGGQYKTVVTFSLLYESDTGPYHCSATLSHMQANVGSSVSANNTQSVVVGRRLHKIISHLL